LHVWMMFRVLAWPNQKITHLEWLFTLLVMAIGASTFFQSCIYFEKVKRNLGAAFADDILPGLLLFPVPLLCIRLWDIWNSIPRVNITGWQLPLDMRPPVIEPGKSVKLTFLVHAQYNTGQLIQIDVLAPAERTVGETFHYLLYRHNVEKQSYNQIIVAENNSRSKAYSWLFYRKEKFLWFWTRNNYLNADHRIRQLNLQNGEIIYIERVRHWLHQS
jgi:Type VI secretion system, TssN